MLRLCAVSLLLITAVGCGSKAIGESCASANATDCPSGSSCILSGSTHIGDGGLVCVDTALLCSKTCSVDADCASLGSGYICLNDCFKGSCLQGSRH